MGRINCVNGSFDDLVRELRRKQQNAPAALKKAVNAAGDVLVREITKSIVAEGVKDTGTLLQSVKKGTAKVEGMGYTLEAWPQGTRKDKHHKKGERNETIGFVNEHGRKYQYDKTKPRRAGRKEAKNAYAGRPFMEKAAEASGEPAGEAILNILECEFDG